MSTLQLEIFGKICSNLELTNNFSQFLVSLSQSIDIQDQIQVQMIEAIQNCQISSDSVNQWFFTIPKNYSKALIWITPVINTGEVKYVWTVGTFSWHTNSINELLKNLNLEQPYQINKMPSPIIFFDPYLASKWQLSEDLPLIENIHELDIFQSSYNGEEELKDIDQKLVMNTSFILKYLAL